jgi:hypothetical protein
MAEQQFHDRATRGEVLSPEERTRLGEWYARLDHEEWAALAVAAPPRSITALQNQIQATVAQLTALTQHIQSLIAENAAVRQEIASLQEQVAQQQLLPRSCRDRTGALGSNHDSDSLC